MPESFTTVALSRVSDGDPSGIPQLVEAVYPELRRLAEIHLRHERADHTLQPTALVHEVYVKLVDQTQARWKDHAHFCAIASEAMRRILIDHARRRGAMKRGANAQRVTLTGIDAAVSEGIDLLALDEALVALAELSNRQSKVVELRFFGGLSIDETAEVLSVSPRTVKDDWRVARAWLQRTLDRRL